MCAQVANPKSQESAGTSPCRESEGVPRSYFFIPQDRRSASGGVGAQGVESKGSTRQSGGINPHLMDNRGRFDIAILRVHDLAWMSDFYENTAPRQINQWPTAPISGYKPNSLHLLCLFDWGQLYKPHWSSHSPSTNIHNTKPVTSITTTPTAVRRSCAHFSEPLISTAGLFLS